MVLLSPRLGRLFPRLVRHRCRYGFVKFKTKDAAKAAMEKLHLKELKDHEGVKVMMLESDSCCAQWQAPFVGLFTTPVGDVLRKYCGVLPRSCG